jgi:formate-dependent nitrite reductase cytochrome c552 subunit
LVCHTTNSFAVLNQSGPESADHAIGCERCHGPGANHTKLIAASGGMVAKQSDLAIARPRLAKGAAIVALCASCHSPRDNDLSLSPGSPDSVRFQGTTLTWSRCYTESGDMLSCVTCHNPHRNAEKKHEVYERRCLECHAASSPVAQENGAKPGRGDTTTARACPVDPTHNCIECHMPKVKTPMAHALFTDHFIRVHRPDDLAAQSTHGSIH